MSSVSPTNQDLSNDTTFSQIKSRVPVPLRENQRTKTNTVTISNIEPLNDTKVPNF